MRGASHVLNPWERKSVCATSFAEIPSALLSDNRKQVPLNSPRWVITAVSFKNANYTVPRLRLEISQSQMKRENQNALLGTVALALATSYKSYLLQMNVQYFDVNYCFLLLRD